MTSTLILAALPEELQEVVPALRLRMSDGQLAVTGPGKVAAAAGAYQACIRWRPERVVVLGTAGALTPRTRLGVHHVTAVVQHDVSDLSFLPVDKRFLPPKRFEFDVGETGGSTIATGDTFVGSDWLRQQVHHETGAELVDMETWSYAYVVHHKLELPLTVFKCVSDLADDSAARSWSKNIRECSELLAVAVRAWL